ncbi:MAG: class I SAM-dependent methyltransferase [Crocinitomicaceae bacterium]|nr:class I SAM-dependent methyltransferase [Crocinitomicaceae bacterium]
MKQVNKEISDAQKASWNKFSQGWKQWDAKIMDFLKPTGDLMIDLLALKNSDHALDIAGGTGEPGLTIGSRVKEGKVVIADLSEGMLDIARENAAKRGIGNAEFVVCDVCELPFSDNSFDAISCRFGYMFFPDMLLATKEMFRVLKPGGRMVAAVWDSPEKNFWVTAIAGVINSIMQIAPPAPEAPGMFRCASPGLMEGLFQQVGLINTREDAVNSKLNCGTAEDYWTMMTEISAPFVAALDKADDALRRNIKDRVVTIVKSRYNEGTVAIDGNSLVIYGEK